MNRPIGNYGMDDHKKLEELRKRVADLERENEELRKSWEAQCESADKLFDELAALKAQNTEPVAWMNPANKAVIGAQKKKQIGVGSHYPQFSEPLYTTPPTATALVEDFKQRAVEACDRKLRIERCPQDETYNDAIEECIIAIESLSLMGEEK